MGGWLRACISSTCATPATRSNWPRRYDREGADELVFLDITATHEGRAHDARTWCERTAAQVFIPLTVGGGVRSGRDARRCSRRGPTRSSINRAAVRDPALITRGAEAFGRQCIVVAIDARQTGATPSGWEVFTHGGRQATGLDAVGLGARRLPSAGAGEILLTSMDRDGTKRGLRPRRSPPPSATPCRFR